MSRRGKVSSYITHRKEKGKGNIRVNFESTGGEKKETEIGETKILNLKGKSMGM